MQLPSVFCIRFNVNLYICGCICIIMAGIEMSILHVQSCIAKCWRGNVPSLLSCTVLIIVSYKTRNHHICLFLFALENASVPEIIPGTGSKLNYLF